MFINISSQDRNLELSNSSTNFTIFLPYSINNVNKVNLASVTLPNTIYKIHANNKNNSFIWTNYDEELFTLIIPNGAYSIFNLISFIENFMIQ